MRKSSNSSAIAVVSPTTVMMPTRCTMCELITFLNWVTYSGFLFASSGSMDAYSRWVMTARPDSMNTRMSSAIWSSTSARGDTRPPYSVASPICAGRGCRPTSTASVIPSKVSIAWIPTTIRK